MSIKSCQNKPASTNKIHTKHLNQSFTDESSFEVRFLWQNLLCRGLVDTIIVGLEAKWHKKYELGRKKRMFEWKQNASSNNLLKINILQSKIK